MGPLDPTVVLSCATRCDGPSDLHPVVDPDSRAYATVPLKLLSLCSKLFKLDESSVTEKELFCVSKKKVIYPEEPRRIQLF